MGSLFKKWTQKENVSNVAPMKASQQRALKGEAGDGALIALGVSLGPRPLWISGGRAGKRWPGPLAEMVAGEPLPLRRATACGEHPIASSSD